MQSKTQFLNRVRYTFGVLLVSWSTASFLFAEDQEESNISHVSEAFGHIIYEYFAHLNVKFDIGKLTQGIEDAAAGKESPMTKKECIEAIYSEQEKETKILCKKNLKQAEIFLASNAKNAGIVCLAEGKVQYLCVSPGNGAEVKPHSAPLLRLSVKTPDGKDILTPNVEESVSLDETIVGLRAGLIGMKEGEKRILYIHPDLAYQEKGLFISLPNVLLTFEIEVLKTN